MRLRVLLVLVLLTLAVLPAATGSAAVTCMGKTATKVGTPGPDLLTGTPGPDVIVGLGGNDTINGLDGNDRICGGPGNDTISAGLGNDRVRGEGGWDVIQGGDGADVLRGGSGADRVFGQAGEDRLFGQAGEDLLNGGAGADRVTGGLGIDECYGETKSSCEVPAPPLPWLIGPQGVGPLVIGASLTNVNRLTGRPWVWEEPGAEGCLVGHTAGLDMFLQSHDGSVIDHIVIYDRDAAATALGINVGAQRRALDLAYIGHVVKVVEDDFYGTFVYVDLGRDAVADMVAEFDGTGSTEPITAIYVPAVVIEGGCL